MAGRLAGKTALITGTAGGQGRSAVLLRADIMANFGAIVEKYEAAGRGG